MEIFYSNNANNKYIGRKINEVLCHISEKSILKLTYVIRFENGILGNET